MKKVVLYMPSTDPTGINGINDGNIETYKNNPMLSLTKEELQNSTDNAGKNADDSPKKVVVEFSDFSINPLVDLADFDIAELKRVCKEERDFWDFYLKEDKKAVEFFDNGLRVLNSSSIRCMRISDFNTTGLTGVNSEKSSPWNNLVINMSVSDKTGEKGGSFGIGKAAAFASSQLRTVFYNTINEEGVEAFEGVVKWPGYKSGNKQYLGAGFFCDETEKSKPVLKNISLDPNYPESRRSQLGPGMDKYILGFKDDISSENLRDAIIVSSIDNFLYAFYSDKLEVRYGDCIVNQEHIGELINSYKETEENKDDGKPHLSNLTVEYFDTISAPDKTEFLSLFDENDVELKVKLNPIGCRRAAIIRQSGMKVFDRGHLNGHVGFSAVVVLHKSNVNKYFKKLENTEHTMWSLDRADNYNEAKRYQNKIFDSLRNMINELHMENVEDTIDAEGVSEYLPFSYVFGKNDKKIDALSNEIISRTRVPRAKTKKKLIESTLEIQMTMDDEGNITEKVLNVRDLPSDPFPTPVPPPPNPDPDNPVIDDDGEVTRFKEKENGKFKIRKEIPSSEIKARLVQKGDNLYELNFVSNLPIPHGFIELRISGEQESFAVDVSDAETNGAKAEFNQNMIRIEDIEAGVANNLFFSLKTNEDWALEVKANESQE